MLPISIVDNHGCQENNPQYDIPYKDHFSRLTIPSLYETKECIQHKMTTEMENFSANADLWSSCTSDALCGIYLEINKSLLTGSLHPRRPYWRKPSSITLQEWNIDSRKLLSITTDSASKLLVKCLDGYIWVVLVIAINKGLNDQQIDPSTLSE